MTARIYQPARNAMQSGQSKTDWVLEHTPATPRSIDPLMGWTSAGDTQTQVNLRFETKDAAIAYARANGIAYQVAEPKPRAHNLRKGGYGENFATNRRGVWTH